MANDFRKFDEQGFPVPPRFENLKFYDDEPKKRPKVSIKAKRWFLVVLVVGVVIPLFFGPRIVSKARTLLADWLSDQASQKFVEGDLAGALVDMNQAIDWNPTDWMLFSKRADLRQEMNELEGSIADLNKSIDLYKGTKLRRGERRQRPKNLADTYSRRSWIYVRLGRKTKAMADANLAVELSPTADNLNGRAYARAILGIELEAGLADIERAIKESGEGPGLLANMLDTRGYLLHLLGRNREALEEMNRALAAREERKSLILRAPFQFARTREFERGLQLFDRALAVMYQHRGLIHKQLGNEKEAEQDLQQAQRLGFDPAKGVL